MCVWQVSLCTSPLNYGLYFAAYEPFKECFELALGKGYESITYFAGSTFATAVSFIVKVPSGKNMHYSFLECAGFLRVRNNPEVIKTRLMTGSDTDALTSICRIVSLEGISGLYTGFWSLVLRELPFNVIEMYVETFDPADVDGVSSVLKEPCWQGVVRTYAEALVSAVERRRGAGGVGNLLCGRSMRRFSCFNHQSFRCDQEPSDGSGWECPAEKHSEHRLIGFE